MSQRKKMVFNWSGGKDSALALYYLLQQNEYEVVTLLTSVNAEHDRVSMHGVRTALLEAQARSTGIPLEILEIPGEVSMQDYDDLLREKMLLFKKSGIEYAGFGDIFLEDLRAYREEKLALAGIKAVFPLWKKDTTQLIHEFLQTGFKTITVCVDAEILNESFAGQVIDHVFIDALPQNVDPCGENGEFHTFVFDGPLFKNPIRFKKGELVYKEFKHAQNASWNSAFWYCDLTEA